MRKLAGSFMVAATVVLVGAQAFGQDAPPQVERAARAIRANAADVMAWVYPSVKFAQIAGCEWGASAGGFSVSCRFDYVDDGDQDARTLRFRLNSQGFVTRIEDGGGDSIFPAFFTLRVTRGLAAEMAKQELAKNSATLDADDRALLRLLSRSPEPEEILAFLLNIQIALS
jgi:hypothetical protein